MRSDGRVVYREPRPAFLAPIGEINASPGGLTYFDDPAIAARFAQLVHDREVEQVSRYVATVVDPPLLEPDWPMNAPPAVPDYWRMPRA